MSQVPRGQSHQLCPQSPQAVPTFLTQTSCWSPASHRGYFTSQTFTSSFAPISIASEQRSASMPAHSHLSDLSPAPQSTLCQPPCPRARPGIVPTLTRGVPVVLRQTSTAQEKTVREGERWLNEGVLVGSDATPL